MNSAIPEPNKTFKSLTDADRELLSAWLDGEIKDTEPILRLRERTPEADLYLEQLSQTRALYHTARRDVSPDADALTSAVLDRIQFSRRKGVSALSGWRPLWPWLMATAAAALFIIAAGTVFIQEVFPTRDAAPAASDMMVSDTASNGTAIPSVEDFAAFVDEEDPVGGLLADLEDTWGDLSEDDLLQYAALWDLQTEPSSVMAADQNILWWEQAERLAEFFDQPDSAGFPTSE
ncbi:MAG TPA: hypothetical protein PLO53_02125 [Candidatus Hydrogenedentes bacterium]|nr:hypothetical protein [Candidatus Hydrogenedentota bacterium]